MHNLDQILTAAEMRAAEQALIDRGATVGELMQRAGGGAADWIWRVAAGRSVTVLCGPGNNGGDGYVIAATLQRRGLAARVIAPLVPTTGAAREARLAWGGEAASTYDGSRAGVFVDCLLGSGLTRALAPDHAALLEALADAHECAVAIDLPSGIASDGGAVLGAVPRFDLTLALGAWKPAHFLMPATGRMGELRLVDIGVGQVEGAARLFPRPRLDAPPNDAHKYTRGLVGVVAGAMQGAALLAADAAAHAGAGYVKILGQSPFPGPSWLVIDGAPLDAALTDPRWSALLVGPGLGRDEQARGRLAAVLERGVPTVLDADALHLLDDDMLEGIDPARLLLTPHEGELARLCAAFEIEPVGKVAAARGLAGRTGLTVLAKGPDTVLAGADGRVAYFRKASSWLSAAGTGDVLAGIAASRLGSGCTPFRAAGEAVRIHTEAARLAGPGFTAEDLVRSLSQAYGCFL